jgi:HKD family nuclease
VAFELFAQPYGSTVGDRLISELESGEWDEFRCAVAFAKLSGVAYLDGPLRAFASRGGRASISVGVDHDGTSFEAVSQLLGAVRPGGAVFVAKHLGSPGATFHPKLFLFSRSDRRGRVTQAQLISGSTNLTKGGLFTNYEFASAWTPDVTDRRDSAALKAVRDVLNAWADPSGGLCIALDIRRLRDLHARGWLPTEAAIAASRPPGAARGPGRSSSPPGGLARQPRLPKPKHPKILGAPALVLPSAAAITPGPVRPRRNVPATRAAQPGIHKAIVIDITTGKKLTEVFLSKTARVEDPTFFGHPFTGTTTPRRATKFPQPERDPRPVVDLRLIDATGTVISEYEGHELKIWEYVNGPSANDDLRMIIPQELLRSLPKGCILEMRRTPIPFGLDYRLDFLTPGSTQWQTARSRATKALPRSPRSYGWL